MRRRDRLNAAAADTDLRVRVYESYVEELDALTRPTRANAANERFAKHLHQHVADWFVFLLDPQVPATNHRAEQALKTPIVNRKVWGGNRTWLGGTAQAVLSSVLQTCKNKALDAFTFVSNALRGTIDNPFTPITT